MSRQYDPQVLDEFCFCDGNGSRFEAKETTMSRKPGELFTRGPGKPSVLRQAVQELHGND